ncbi:MAG: leucyl aminopeptidase [Chloroflexi bacterium]|nr:leucyl aminopeptidase [Chloroflexota bacterium]MDA1240251.1 leucyl aminopeptidase [Chloroflexota bacterium]MQC19061.1 leucyl aminopeptidase [Chloroflexota bacterium]
MQITAAAGPITNIAADTYVLPLAQGIRTLTGDLAAVDALMGGTITSMLNDGLIKGIGGEITVLPPGRRLKAKRVVIAGVGERPKMTLDGIRDRAANLARRLRDIDAGTVAASVQEQSGRLDATDVGRVIAEGFILGLYRFDRHHTKAADRPANTVGDVTIVESTRKARQSAAGVAEGVILGEATNLARDLGNEPSNLMTPTIVASRAQQMANELGIECRIIERAEAERLKMGSYLSVANGSVQPPKFIVLTYTGLRRRGGYIGLVGKGITFDTGGISIKPAEGMEAMKGDMTGAASVIAAISAIARLKLPVNVMAVAPCTENMPSGSATKPGDVVYAMDGQSIEVLNTDAEGRLVLADAIVWARQNGCTTVVDVATLTGAMSVALGNVRTGVFCNNDRLYAELEKASAISGEKIWRFPLDPEYFESIKSDVADIKNTGGRLAGSITAAKFIECFAGDTPWAHMDIAGVMAATTDRGWKVKGNNGTPVRTLVQFVKGRARA